MKNLFNNLKNKSSKIDKAKNYQTGYLCHRWVCGGIYLALYEK